MKEPHTEAGKALLERFYEAEEEQAGDGESEIEAFSLGCKEVLEAILAIEVEAAKVGAASPDVQEAIGRLVG